MPSTILDYANNRGVTKQAVYSAIKKNGIETYQGVSNGKSAQYLSDEAIFELDQVIRPSQKSMAIMEANIEKMRADQDKEIARGVIEAKNETIHAKDELRDELVITRGQMLEQIQSIGASISADIDKRIESNIVSRLEDKIYELEQDIKARAIEYDRLEREKNEEIKNILDSRDELIKKINEDREHPFKHLWSCLTRKE